MRRHKFIVEVTTHSAADNETHRRLAYVLEHLIRESTYAQGRAVFYTDNVHVLKLPPRE